MSYMRKKTKEVWIFIFQRLYIFISDPSKGKRNSYQKEKGKKAAAKKCIIQSQEYWPLPAGQLQ